MKISNIIKAIKPRVLHTTEKITNQNQVRLYNRDSFDIISEKIGVWDWDILTREILFSDNCLNILGYNKKEVNELFITINKLMHPSDWKKVKDLIRNKDKKTLTDYEQKIRFKCKNGRYKWILIEAKIFYNERNKPIKIVGSYTDIDDIVRLNQILEYDTNFTKNILDNTGNIIIVSKKNGEIILLNKFGKELTGYTEKDAMGKKWLDIFIPEYLKDDMRKYCLEHDGEYLPTEQLNDIICKDGSMLKVLWKNTIMKDLFGTELIISVGSDVTESEKAKYQIEQLAYYDQLTHLPNRQYFNKILDEYIEDKEETSKGILLYIDLDNFKNINDVHGHEFGDKLLVKVADVLLNCIDDSSTVARLGGDEFAIIVKDATNKSKGEELAACIIESFEKPLSIEDKKIFVTCSIGLAYYPCDGSNRNELLMNADTAMYNAKSKGKNRYENFNLDIAFQIVKRNNLTNGIRKALTNDEFEMYFQPILDITNNKIYGMESLIRWKHNVKGFISPEEFIPVAEDTGLIIPLGEWVIKRVVKHIVDWEELGIDDIKIFINISSIQLQEKEEFVNKVRKIIKENNIRPNKIVFEITENIVLESINEYKKVFEDLLNLGVQIALDDFGTRYSSLNYLRKLPVSTIKIDKTYIDNINDDNNKIFVETLVYLANRLGLELIAEGVEIREQLEYLKHINCSKIQGFIISRPVPSDIIIEQIHKYNDIKEEVAVSDE